MNADEKNQISIKLADEIKETKTKISKYIELSQPISPENAIGRISRMDAINNKSVLEAALREAQSKLIQLKNILKKIEGPGFGLCKKCKKNIPFGRLVIRPESELCVNCAK
tara:strand:- start:412 stop:744 length:333 start_codon:yes stop_codon:yes gene_type:complete